MDGPQYTILQVLRDKWWVILPAFAVSLIATPIFRAVAYRRKIVDRPDDLLKPHGRPVAYLGGLGIWAGWMIGLGSFMACIPDLAGRWRQVGQALLSLDGARLMANPVWNLLGVMVSGTVVMVVGLLDDLKDIPPKQKIAGQVLAAGILMAGGIGPQMAQVFLHYFQAHPPAAVSVVSSMAICLVFVIGACNATNLLDGLDGLCGGVTGIIALGFLGLAVWLALWATGDPGVDALRIGLALAMAGAVLGFLPYNVPPASIFMGDAGSMLLGFFVAAMMALFCQEGNARWLLAALVVFALPILDTALALVRRLLAGKPVFAGDRSHLYDQLVDRGMSVKKVVVLFYGLSLAAAVLGVSLAILIQGRYALLIYAAVLAGVWGLFYKAGMIRPAPHEPHEPPPSNASGRGK